MDNDLDDIIKFLKITHQFQQIQRVLFATGEDRNENDAEHSFQLAMLAWYLVDSRKLDFDHALILRYALIHDLVEIYAGDTYIYSNDAEELRSKPEREAAAARTLAEKFPEFGELHEVIHAYEERQDKESRFIYALDKIVPVCNILIDEGRSWKHWNVTLPMILNHKTVRVANSPEVKKYFAELATLLKAREDELFPPAS